MPNTSIPSTRSRPSRPGTLRPRLLAAGLALFALAAASGPVAGHPGHGRRQASPPPVPVAPAPASAFPEAQVQVVPSRIYIANDDHSDYMWTADEAAYRTAFLEMLDYYVAQAEANAGAPSNRQGRFNTDGTLWIYEYERNRPAADILRLWTQIKAGRITVPMNVLCQLYGAMPAEAVIRSFLYAGRLERRENVRLPLVVPMENQTLPGGVASLWAGCGARWSWKGICDCASDMVMTERPLDVYRFTGPDGQSVLMKWYTYYQGTNLGLGGYAEARDPYVAVDFLSTNPAFLARNPYSAAGAFGYGWDDLSTRTTLFLDAARDLTNAGRTVIVSNQVDYFQDLEADHAAQIPSFKGSFGNDWELLTASIAETSARVRRAVEKLRTAEALASVVSLQDPSFMTPHRALRDSAMISIGLYYEHSFGPGPTVDAAERLAWQRRIEGTVTRYADRLHDDALAALGTRVPAGPDERHVVFNALSWPRTDVAELRTQLPPPWHVVDLVTGEEVPAQSVSVDGQTRLRILARSVPAVGYKVFEVRSGFGSSFPPSATVNGATVDNGIHRVTLGTRGQITSWRALRDGAREYADAAQGGLNDIGAGTTGTGTVTLEAQGPVSTTLKVTTGGPLPVETRLTLFAGLDRVSIENRVLSGFDTEVAYGSSFTLPGMTMHHEEVGMIARVGRVSAGGDYADQNARTDYLTMGHFVDLSTADRGVTVSARDAQFFRAGNSTIASLDATTPAIRALVGMPGTAGVGFADQGGETSFLTRFALRAHGPWDGPAAMRFALEDHNPLVATRATGSAGATLPGTTWTLVNLEGEEVLLWALKPAEDGFGQGLVARAWNLSQQPATMRLSMPPLSIAGAQRVTHIETDLGAAPVAAGVLTETLAAQQMSSWRLTPAGVADADGDAAPGGLALSAWPNPLRMGHPATLNFTLSRAGDIRLAIYDLRGAEVARPAEGAFAAGLHQVRWQPRADGGGGMRPGVYFARLETREGASLRRLVVLE